MVGPVRRRRLVSDDGQVPAGQLATVAPYREVAALVQVAVGLEACLVQGAKRLGLPVEHKVGVTLPPVTLTVRREPAGTDTLPLSGLRKIGARPV